MQKIANKNETYCVLSLFSTRRICSHEQRKKQRDWLETNTDDITQSHSFFFACSREKNPQGLGMVREHQLNIHIGNVTTTMFLNNFERRGLWGSSVQMYWTIHTFFSQTTPYFHRRETYFYNQTWTKIVSLYRLNMSKISNNIDTGHIFIEYLPWPDGYRRSFFIVHTVVILCAISGLRYSRRSACRPRELRTTAASFVAWRSGKDRTYHEKSFLLSSHSMQINLTYLLKFRAGIGGVGSSLNCGVPWIWESWNGDKNRNTIS